MTTSPVRPSRYRPSANLPISVSALSRIPISPWSNSRPVSVERRPARNTLGSPRTGMASGAPSAPISTSAAAAAVNSLQRRLFQSSSSGKRRTTPLNGGPWTSSGVLESARRLGMSGSGRSRHRCCRHRYGRDNGSFNNTADSLAARRCQRREKTLRRIVRKCPPFSRLLRCTDSVLTRCISALLSDVTTQGPRQGKIFKILLTSMRYVIKWRLRPPWRWTWPRRKHSSNISPSCKTRELKETRSMS